MYFGEVNNQDGRAVNIHQTSQKEIKRQEIKQNEVVVPNIVIAQAGSFLAFIVFWAGLWAMWSKTAKETSDNQLFSNINTVNKFPCTNCKYFSDNHFIKCAVQPSIVLSNEAENCLDYCPKQSESPQKNKFIFWRR